jgi:hypothetical protein
MSCRTRCDVSVLLTLLSIVSAADLRSAETSPQKLRAILLRAKDVTAARIQRLQADKYNAIVLDVSESSATELTADQAAAALIRAAALDLYYWVEVARHAPSADANPLRMASLQGHGEWRRLFPKLRLPGAGEVTKVYPWTPILYRKNFDGHLDRVTALLKDRPRPKAIFLNDLQAAPSACGCGNVVCRWTTDYGPIETAQRLKDDAAALFVAALARRLPDIKLIPVWTSECEEHDREALCAGVGCYQGICWKRYATQLAPLVKQVDQLGVLCLYKEFGQNVPHWKSEAGWIEHALRTFEAPPQNGPKVSTSRLIAVLQGWDVSADELTAQITRAEAAGVSGIVVAEARIEQSWEPRVVSLAPNSP